MSNDRFTAADMYALSDAVATVWTGAAELDWTRPAGTLEWSCLATADHAVDCVYAPAFFLASLKTDAYPVAGSNLELGDAATPTLLVESLGIATRILVAVVNNAPPETRAILFQRPQPDPPLGAPYDFLPRGAMELILHAHDVCAGLGVPFEPTPALCARLREHTRRWAMWERFGFGLGQSGDPWADLLSASGRSRQP